MSTEYAIRVGKDGSVFPCRDRTTAERTVAASGAEFSEADPDLRLILVSRTVTDWTEVNDA
jgi:hypothetical protein